MKKYINILVYIFITFLIISCNENINEPIVEPVNDKPISGLLSVPDPWITSPEYTWPTHQAYDPLYERWVTVTDNPLSFYFNGSNWSMTYSYVGGDPHLNTITVYKNSVYCGTYSWYNYDGSENDRWTDWYSLSGASKVRFYLDEFYFPMRTYSEPRKAQVKEKYSAE